MEIDYDGICSRCYRKDEKRGPDEPYFFSAENQLDFGPVPARLPELTPTEESLIARVHVHVNIMLVRGQQYRYRGHVVHFLREVGLVYNQLPLLPQQLNTVLLRPANTSSHANLSRQFTRQFRVRRQAVMIWLDYLRHHHPGYRCIVIDNERLSQLPEDGNVVDAIPQSQVEAADVGPEEDQEAEPELEDAAAVPDLLAKDTELDALRSILVGGPEPNGGLPLATGSQGQARHELRLPTIRHTPINEFSRSHALLSLAFPCLFRDGRADFVEPRLRSIEYKDYIEHAMRWHDGRFARHPTFRFVAFNTLMRSQARARSKFFVKRHDGTREPLTREQLIQALEHSEDPDAQALINSITRHAVSIRGTRPFWNRKRQDLEAYAYSLSCPGAFMTFSPADLHWRSLYQHMPRYGEWLRASEPERMVLSLSWIDDRLREAFPHRNEEFFGGLNILLVGDFFQLPPVLQKPLYYDKEVQGVEIKGRNAYMRFDKSVFLSVVQRQCGDDQAAFRRALGELRLLQLSHESWKLLSGRVQAKLDDQEVATFADALRVYATKARVNEYNHYHLDRLSRPVIQVIATNVGSGAAAAPDDKAGNLAKQFPVCIGARLMLTCNLWQQVGLCNGARGTVYDIGWAPGRDPVRDQPCVIMMEFDKYTGPAFLTTTDGRKIVPILPVGRDFLVGATLCTRTQFPLIVCYAITVHKSQSITEDRIVTDLSCRDFQTGLSYVAVSRVKTLQGLMLDAPFDRNNLTYTSPPEGIMMKMRDQWFRSRQVLTRNPYMVAGLRVNST
ncbi:ATP-dependent DNA helicase PIF1 [Purpureocillium lavendulum]|uniref:ATP-dependent DNA helicase PIF1 n=1 Tax=Purpureocillium lavendulum TaxID=1247861 RepID=A0AB34FC56_9HYPO|nr:ATP-dependent DNA helicase PIF1 [Purpureocillium lavendulum]